MVKRSFDITLSLMLVILLSPLIAIVAVLVLMNLGRPVLFHQVRPGLHGRPFQLIKFRTMTNEQSSDGTLLPNERRLTRLGGFLRATSLDELPELWNVLKGEMSLVGPRPLLTEYLELYSEWENRRHEVRPGVTGWAQVNGRNMATWPERFAMDVWYVDNQSLWLDFRILCLTVVKVIRREGISVPGMSTIERFKGNE